jgi:HEAT repeat protein
LSAADVSNRSDSSAHPWRRILKHQRSWWLSGLAFIGLCLIVGTLITWSNAHSLVYHGKTVKTWLLQLSTPPNPQARAEAEATFRDLGTNAVPELARLLRIGDARWRVLIWSHARSLPRRIRSFVLQRVNSPNAYLIRPAAARALGNLGPGAAAAEPDLVRALQDKVNGTYWEAGRALGRIGRPAVADLTSALQDRDTLVRSAAAYGLGEVGLGAAPAVPALIQMLKTGTTNEQLIAAQSLAQIGAPAVAPLVELLVHDVEGGAVGQTAANVLLRHYRRPTPGLPAQRLSPNDDTASARQQAIEILGRSGRTNEVIVQVLSAATKDPSPDVRLAAQTALAQMSSPKPRS